VEQAAEQAAHTGCNRPAFELELTREIAIQKLL
jgi:hypothetical protein